MKFIDGLNAHFLPREQQNEIAIKKIREQTRCLKNNSVYYGKVLSDIEPNDITLENFHKLPQTEKSALANNLEKFQSITDENIVETVVTSGSTGHPLVFPLSKQDINRLTVNEALSFSLAGITSDDKAGILVSLDKLFIAGMAYYRGLVSLGVNTFRSLVD